jgi:hypothetical protein
MKLQLDGKVGRLRDLDLGTLFVARSNEHTTIGLAAKLGEERAAILLNSVRYPGPPAPCLVPETALGGDALIGLSEAMLVPALSEKSLQFTSTLPDGPGMLMLFADSAVLRVSHWDSGFAYVDVGSGIAGLRAAHGAVEIPRWSIQQLNVANQLEMLFEFKGPTHLLPRRRQGM